MTTLKIPASDSENESSPQFRSNKFYEVKFEAVSFWSHFSARAIISHSAFLTPSWRARGGIPKPNKFHAVKFES